MKIALAVIILFTLVVFTSGCFEKESSLSTGAGIITGATAIEGSEEQPAEQSETTEQTESCEDGDACTKDSFNTLAKACQHIPIEHCCGDDICEASERCNEETHRTMCPDDCPVSCKGYLIVAEKGTDITEGDFTYSCFGDKCVKLDERDFTVTDKTSSSGIKTFVVNIGEQAINYVASTFNCAELDAEYPQKATKDDEEINGILISDYFDSNDESVSTINGAIHDDNFATYYMNFDTTEIVKNTKMRCVITLQSMGFRNMQDVLIDFYKPVE